MPERQATEEELAAVASLTGKSPIDLLLDRVEELERGLEIALEEADWALIMRLPYDEALINIATHLRKVRQSGGTK